MAKQSPDQNRYDVSGRYASPDASPATKLPVPMTVTRPGGHSGPTRSAVMLSIPTPALDRGRAGRREIRDFVERIDQGCAVAGAISKFQGAQEQLEKSTQALEQTFARGAVELRKLQNELSYEEESLNLEYARHLAALRQSVVDEKRRNALADTQFQIAEAKQEAELAEARAKAIEARARADRAERTAAVRAEAESAEAERVLHQKRAARARALHSYLDAEQHGEAVPSEVEEAAAKTQRRQEIRRWREQERAKLLDPVGGDESKLDAATQDRLDEIDQTADHASMLADERAAMAVVFPFPEQAER